MMELKQSYAAFISYRHVSPDKEIAKALQFFLENNWVRPNKNVPRRIRKVFLDTSELPTMEDLDAGILDALDRSEHLFVICSPDLPKSKYCMREINYFKERHGGSLSRVSTILVRGMPQESYPKALVTQLISNPDAPDEKIEVEVEPLFADVRGKNLLHSLWKLLYSEYLRLAAQYYKCTYDQLKKRHKRLFASVMTCILAAVLAISGLLIAKDQQVKTTKSNTYASYAREQIRNGNEQLALALCTHTSCKATPSYTAALRSALVQLDYKCSSVPVARVMETSYSNSELTNYYISESGNQLVVADGNNWQVTDAYTGAVVRSFPYESAFVMGANPSAYITLAAHPDEAGVFRDYVRLIDLETDQLITEFPFREAAQAAPDYHVRSLIESGGWLNILTDHGQAVAYFTASGQQLTFEEYTRLLLRYTEDLETNDPFRLVLDKQNGEYVVRDQSGKDVFSLEGSYQNAAFSKDWQHFAYVDKGFLSVYDTGNWSLLSRTELPSDRLQSLQLLPGSTYYAAGFRQDGGFLGDGTQTWVLDWHSGQTLLTTEGTVLISPTEQAFFTVQQGTICRYHYTQLDLTARSEVLAHVGDRCLFGETGALLLQNAQITQLPAAELVCWDEALEYILLADGETLSCYHGSGSAVWTITGNAIAIAMAPNGSRCAWLDHRQNLHILNTENGEELYQLPANDVGQVTQIMVSETGVGILGTEDGLWIRESDGSSVSLGAFPRGRLFSDGILILESDARVNDFQIYDTVRDYTFAPFFDNTGLWDYSPHTGFLIRHTESSGNNPSLYLEVWKLKKREAELQGRIDLPKKTVEHMTVDSTGKWLSITCGGYSFVYTLDDLFQVLNAQCSVYYEGGVLYGHTFFGDYRYSMPMYDTHRLQELAMEALTGPMGTRILTEQEQEKYRIG